MRISSAITILAFAVSSSALLAQVEEHGGHQPESTAAVPDPKAPSPADDKACPMMDKMKAGASGSAVPGNRSHMSDQDMKAMHEKMKGCMAAKDKDGGASTDQHQH